MENSFGASPTKPSIDQTIDVEDLKKVYAKFESHILEILAIKPFTTKAAAEMQARRLQTFRLAWQSLLAEISGEPPEIFDR